MTTLAAAEGRLIILVLCVIGAIFIATVAIMVVRKKILSTEQPPAAGMIMDDFRRLHAAGQLSDAEFQALRTRMAAKMKASMPGKGSLHEEPPSRPRQAQPQRLQRPPGRRPSAPE